MTGFQIERASGQARQSGLAAQCANSAAQHRRVDVLIEQFWMHEIDIPQLAEYPIFSVTPVQLREVEFQVLKTLRNLLLTYLYIYYIDY